MAETLFSEVEQMARHLERSFLGRDALSQRALSTFRRITDKLDALSFADYRIDPVVRSLRAWLTRLPASGPITGGLFLEGWALMRLVGDAKAMARHGAGLLALAELMPSETSSAVLNIGSDATADAHANDDSDAVSGKDAQTDSDALSSVITNTQANLAEESPTCAEPIVDFDAVFNVDALDARGASREVESTRSSPAPASPSTPPEPISAQDFWF